MKTISKEDIVNKAIELQNEWIENGDLTKSALQLLFCKMAKWSIEQLQQPHQSGEVMTLEECIDYCARDFEYSDFNHLTTVNGLSSITANSVHSKGTLMYYKQFKAKSDQLEKDNARLREALRKIFYEAPYLEDCESIAFEALQSETK